MKIHSQIIWENRSGNGKSYFHPRCCALGDPEQVFMTLQTIGGSDYYGPLQKSRSCDGGHTWSAPEPVPGYEWRKVDAEISEGVCDAVPEFHAPTQTVLVIGHNVYYRGGRLFDSLKDFGNTQGPQLRRFPVWGICTPEGRWLRTREKLLVPGMEECSLYSCGCAQRLFSGEDQLLIPLTFGYFGERPRKVTTALFRYDGKELIFLRRGDTLTLPVGRGLLEPSLARYKTDVYLTLRAEDGHGYHTKSRDGFTWEALRPWCFDDGTALEMSTTQQHFLKLGGRLFLVYTRNDGANSHAFRFRAPLYIAELNARNELIRSSEQVVLPLRNEGEKAAAMGNFHPTELDENHAIVTVGEERGFQNYCGDTLCAHLEI